MQPDTGPSRLTREELYKQVWTTPLLRLAPSYGLSDTMLRKICARHRIPTPPAGYWAKKEHGKPARQAPLPLADPEAPGSITIGHDPEPRPREPRPTTVPVTDPVLVELVKYERDPRNRIPTPGEHARLAHPLVKQTRDAIRSRQTPGLYGLERPGHEVADECVDVTVSRTCLSRALRLLDTLFLALEGRGHRIHVERPKPGLAGHRNRVRCSMLGEEFGIVLREKTTMVRLGESERKSPFSNQVRYEPKGDLELRITEEHGYAVATWVDRPGKPLESRLNSVIQGMIVAVERQSLRREDRRKAELARQQREQERREQERLRQLQQARGEQFESLAGR